MTNPSARRRSWHRFLVRTGEAPSAPAPNRCDFTSIGYSGAMPPAPLSLPTVPRATEPRWTPAEFFEPLTTGTLCTLCPHACRLAAGEVGRCHVRRAPLIGTGMETATFATAVAHFDPIERKPLYHYRPGLVALTLAAPGCNFTCSYCQNHRLSQYGSVDSVEWIATPADPDALVATAAERGAAVALSYTEPTLAAEFTLALSVRARPAGVDLIWKTNGFITPTALDAIAPHLAAVNVDLKAPDDDRHQRLTGAPVADVLRSLTGYARHGVWVEISTPIIPRFNADRDAVRRMADHVLAATGPDTPWHLLRFVPEFRLWGLPPTTPDALSEASSVARAAGLRFVYVERALGADGRNTLCPVCRTVLVERDPWATLANHLRTDRCPGCGTPVPGRWTRDPL